MKQTPFLEQNILSVRVESRYRDSPPPTTQKHQRSASKFKPTDQSNRTLETKPRKSRKSERRVTHTSNYVSTEYVQRKCQMQRGAQQGTHPIRCRQEKFHGWTGAGALVGCTERKRRETKRDRPLRTSRDAFGSPRLEIKS